MEIEKKTEKFELEMTNFWTVIIVTSSSIVIMMCYFLQIIYQTNNTSLDVMMSKIAHKKN